MLQLQVSIRGVVYLVLTYLLQFLQQLVYIHSQVVVVQDVLQVDIIVQVMDNVYHVLLQPYR